MHLDRPTIMAMASGAGGGPAAEEHLAACATCREAVDDARLFGLLGELDHPAPPLSAEEVIVRAEAGPTPRALRWAAGLVLTLGAAGAVYAAPGSPVPGWIEGLRGAPAFVVPAGPEADASGVVVAPGAELSIDLPRQPSGVLVVEWSEEAELSVEAFGGAATFDSRATRLVVTATEPADYRIAIPRSAPSVIVRIGDTVVLTATAGVAAGLLMPDADGVYRVELAAVE